MNTKTSEIDVTRNKHAKRIPSDAVLIDGAGTGVVVMGVVVG